MSPSTNTNNLTETRALIPGAKDTKKNDDSTISNEELTLRIKCNSPGIDPPEGGDWFEVCANQGSDVKALKQSVRNAIGESARGRYLRLIASGRLLAPDSTALATFKMKDEDYVHAVLAPAGVRGGQQAAMARGATSSSARSGSDSRRFHRNIGIGPTGLILPAHSEWDDSDDDLEAGEERLGFDRLRSTGLTRDEIAAIRLYFSRSVERFVEDRRRRNRSSSENNEESESSADSDSDDSSDDDDNHRRRRRRLQREDDWMEAQGPTSEFRLNLSTNNPWLNRRFMISADDAGGGFSTRPHNMVGTDRDFIWGFFLGFFVGFVMLFWVWMPTVPHKQKLGILTGISFQLALNMLRSTGGNGGDPMQDGD